MALEIRRRFCMTWADHSRSSELHCPVSGENRQEKTTLFARCNRLAGSESSGISGDPGIHRIKKTGVLISLSRIFRPTFIEIFGITNLRLGTAFSLYFEFVGHVAEGYVTLRLSGNGCAATGPMGGYNRATAG